MEKPDPFLTIVRDIIELEEDLSLAVKHQRESQWASDRIDALIRSYRELERLWPIVAGQGTTKEPGEPC